MSSLSSQFETDSSCSSDDLSSTQNIIELDEMDECGDLNALAIPVVLMAATMHGKQPHGGSTFGRRYIHRDRKSRHNLIINNYFKGQYSKYTPSQFRRRFRMDVKLFNRILHEIGTFDDYFTQKIDAIGRYGLSPLQKMIAAIRMLAYGCAADLLDEYLQIGESTTIESLKHFCNAIIGIFEEQYLRKPNEADIIRLLEEGERRGFPGMLGSLDCMHWKWKNCPTAWHGTHTNGFKRVPTLILEAVASEDLWIWHAFFGMAGTSNDINVLDRSPLFDDIVNGVAPPCNFIINGQQFNKGYYLSDGIYPKYATLIQTISQPSNCKEKLFAKRQEAVRKDVERAFGVLQSRWHIVKGPSRMWKAKYLGKIMKTCIILHNMIIESECHEGLNPERWEPPINETVETVNIEHDYAFLVSNMINKLKQIRNQETHNQSKAALINHLWNTYGDESNEES